MWQLARMVAVLVYRGQRLLGAVDSGSVALLADPDQVVRRG